MTINYIDRQMIGFLKPDYLQPEFQWSERDFASIVFWFQASYAAAYLFFGRLVDRIGAKWGLAFAFLIWTLAHIAHGAVRSLLQMKLARVFLGVGEGGAFPGGLKAATEWFPQKERALAIGFLTAGNNIGAIMTPIIVPLIVVDLALGWRASFYVVGLATLLWLPLWLLLYRRPPQDDTAPAQAAGAVAWRVLLARRETWAYAIGKFLIDPIWWFFLFWLPSFFSSNHGLDLKSFGLPIIVIYLASDAGSIGGGFLSSTLMRMGWSANAARKSAMLLCALLAVPIAFASSVQNLWVAVALISLATAAHQGFSANLYTFPSDVFPSNTVGSVVGFGGMLGGLGGMLFATYIGEVLERVGSYTPIFVVAGSVYLLALLAVQILSPRLEPANISTRSSP
jgi:ACS family hexuronate transporter-like MFS transporter